MSLIKEKWEIPEIRELSIKEAQGGGYTFDDGDLAPSLSARCLTLNIIQL